MNLLKKATFVSTLLLFLLCSNGQYAVFFAIWIATPMLLFAVRKLKRGQGFLFAFLTIAVSYYFSFDVVPFLPIAISIAISAIFSAFAALPYLIDSFFSKKRDSFWSTLIFPTAAVLVEYAYHLLINQYGNWGHFAYSQQSQHLLLQSISVFGMGYITFLITWFASVVNWVYAHRSSLKMVKKGILAYGLVLGSTLAYGGYRVAFQKSNAETVRVASISALDSLSVSIDIQGLNQQETKADVKTVTRKATSTLNHYLLNRSIAEAKAGAKIVFWAEGNAVILKEDEQALYQQARQVASEQNIYLGVSVAVIDPTSEQYLENKFVLFDTDGKKAIDYWKQNPVPAAEAPISNKKSVGIQQVETNYGTMAGVICFDLDFPDYLKAAAGSDILLAPSNDFIEIDPMHTDMAKFRAIEQGFNLIRQTSHGLSAGTDYTGKVISEMDHFTDREKVMITQLPTKGVKTIYSRIGDSFIGLCVFLFVLCTVLLKDWTTVRFKSQAPAIELGRTA